MNDVVLLPVVVIAMVLAVMMGGLGAVGVTFVSMANFTSSFFDAFTMAAGLLDMSPADLKRYIHSCYYGHFADHFGDQAAPEAGANDDVVRHDRAAMGDDALDAAVLDAHGRHFGVRQRREGAQGLGLLAAQGAELERVADAGLGKIELDSKRGFAIAGDHRDDGAGLLVTRRE